MDIDNSVLRLYRMLQKQTERSLGNKVIRQIPSPYYQTQISTVYLYTKKWFGVKCSQEYWDEIAPIFQYLIKCKAQGMKWSELPSKTNEVYRPLLTAFLAEVKRSYVIHGAVLAKGMVEYLIGKHDFYKTISRNIVRQTRIQPYNLRGTLNNPTKNQKPKLLMPISSLPRRIICAEFKPGSDNTVEIFMDEGWQFAFRIHNASTKVEASLKFDVQLIGMPTTFVCFDYNWE